MDEGTLILQALSQPVSSIAYAVSQRLAGLYPQRALLEGDEAAFDPESYAEAGQCVLHRREGLHTQTQTTWDRGRMESHTPNGWFEVSWQGHRMDVVRMSWPEGFCSTNYYWILAETREAAEAFFTSVCAWCSDVRGEVLVFAGGHWRKDRDLYQSIQGATFDNLVLAGGLKEEIRQDIEGFFASSGLYQEYGVPWKRGILFLGPPGNGKTHAVKALLNSVRKPCLYVKSFKSQHATDHDTIRAVFKRARESTPCFLVLEDLDSLVDGDNRAFFLNELDGFAANEGIVTLATTNHPEKLDPAILDRPSRFDRKYHFELPGPEERRDYLAFWNAQLRPAMRLDSAGQEEIAGLTEGFSFAYLKELVLSSMMRWISHAPQPDGMRPVMTIQAAALREQMSSMAEELPREEDEDETPDFRFYRRRMRRMAG